jgi:peptidoglycan/LPS O-acetylase OafA/YrhL
MELSNSSVTPTSSVKPKIHFYLVDGLRGIAALWVVLFHANLDDHLTILTNNLPQWFVVIVFNWGGLGVPVFFVLSGFVIAHSLRDAKIDFAYFKNFCLRRFTRLTPAYYFSIIVTLAFAFLASNVKGEIFTPGNEAFSFQRLLAHLFYLQELFRFHNFNDVYWTLCLEVQFYLCFCGLLALAQWLNNSRNLQFSLTFVFVPVAILAAIFSIHLFGDHSRPKFFLPLFYQFLLGVFAYWSWQDKLKPIYFYFYSALLLTFGVLNLPEHVITSVIVAVLLLESARANYIQVWLKSRWLQFLGHISYSLYLTHTPVLGAAFFLGYKILKPNAINQFICLSLGITICIIFAAMVWQFVEKPSINFNQKIKLKLSK